MTRNSGNPVSRRRFLTISGGVLGGIAAGTTVAAAETEGRYLVDTNDVKRSELEEKVEIVHDLDKIDLAVVRGAAGDIEPVTKKFEPDTVYELDRPFDGELSADATGGDVGTQDHDSALLYSAQWDKDAQGVPSAHDVTEGEGTRVSVIDTGVDQYHLDLAGAVNQDLSKNFTGDGGDVSDVSYHGTHVSGIVAGQGLGVTGTAPETDLVGCRVFDGDGGASFGDIIAALHYSVEVGCDAANLSLGAYPVSREGIGDFYGKVLNRTTTYANKEGMLIIAAAGNDAADLQHDGGVISLPNEAAKVLSVSATSTVGFSPLTGSSDGPAHTPTSYTNYGTNAIDVSAPGGDSPSGGSIFDMVLSTIPMSYVLPWAYLAGTSMAAPQVTGAAALVKSENPHYNANQVRQTLKQTADDADQVEGDKPYHGSGFLNLDAAIGD